MKEYKLIHRPIVWPITATLLCLAWAFVFWQVFFVWISWNLLRIPMGLGGALYFVFFSLPVVLGGAIYEFAAHRFLRKSSLSPAKRYVVSLLIPFMLISVLLIVFCPMDTDSTFLGYVFRQILMK